MNVTRTTTILLILGTIGSVVATGIWRIDCWTTVGDVPIISVDLTRCETTVVRPFRGVERSQWTGCPLTRMLAPGWQEPVLRTPG